MIEGVVYSCVLGTRLRARAAAGDIDALKILASSAPANIPRRAVLAYRDAQLRLFAADLFAELPGASRHAVAMILAKAGHDLARKRSLTSRAPYDRLQDDERARLQERVRDLLEIAPWPRLRQFMDILSLQFSPVATADVSGVVLVNTGDDEICSTDARPLPK